MRRTPLFLAVVPLVLACEAAPPTSAASERTADQSLLGDLLGPLVGTRITRTDLGTLGGQLSFATDVNNSQAVVGWSQTAANISRAFRWTASKGMVDLGTLPGDEWSRAVAIKDDGRILGMSGASGDFTGQPVMWSPSGAITALAIPLLPGASFGQPADFNRDGDVVGWDVFSFQHAWIWSASGGKYDITQHVPGGGFEGASSQINTSGVVAGTNHAGTCRAVPECWRAFLWSAEGGYQHLGVPGADANASVAGLGLNDAGSVAGWVQEPAGAALRPYRWTDGRGFTVLPVATYGYALAISRSGAAVGASLDPQSGAIQAAHWPSGGGMISLAEGSANPSVAVAVNDVGAVAGWEAQDTVGSAIHATLWTVSPTLPGVVPTHLVPSLTNVVPVDGTLACTTDARALITRAALFACVARRQGQP